MHVRGWCSSVVFENFSHIPLISLYHSRVREYFNYLASNTGTVVRLAEGGPHARVTTRFTPTYVLDPSKDRNIRGQTFQFLINVPSAQLTKRIDVTSFEIDAYFKSKQPRKNDYVDLTRRFVSERVKYCEQSRELRLDRTISSFHTINPPQHIL